MGAILRAREARLVVSPRPPDDPRNLGDVPITLYRFQLRLQPRWAVCIPSLNVEGYGDLPDEALRDLASKITPGDLERLRLHTENGRDRASLRSAGEQ